jgi:homoserine dehydrogenase
MIQDLFIMGATGKVGRTLVNQIIEKKDIDPNVHANPTRIVGLASSKDFVFSPKGLAPSESYDFVNKCHEYKECSDFDELISLANNDYKHDESTLVFIDVTALNEAMTKFHLKVLKESPFGVVTANKNPIALSDYSIFQQLTKIPNRYGYRCSVMAGAEAVTFLRDIRDVNDYPQGIQGCFSGTLGYITSELEKGRRFSEILKEATKKGYTEPDPRDDLNGLDVARKLIVLARTAGYPIGMKNLNVEPFIPKEYFSNQGVNDFLESTPNLDAEFEKKVNHAKERGLTLRYVARMDAKQEVPKLAVSLKEVPIKSPLGSLKGTSNKIVVVSSVYPEDTPYSVEAPGAGLEVTAQNIRRDLLYLLKGRRNVI